MKNENNEGLGFCDLPIRRYVFIGGTENENKSKTAWYYLGSDGKPISIPQFGLKGTITHLKINKLVFKEKANFKLDIFISADRPYAIRSGINTTFTRGFILALHQFMTDTGDLSEPFTLGVAPSEDDEKVIFSSLFNSENTRIKYEWDKEIQMGGLIHDIQRNLGQDLEVDNCEECRPSALAKRGKK